MTKTFKMAMNPGAQIARASETPEATEELMRRWANEWRDHQALVRAADMAGWSTCNDG